MLKGNIPRYVRNLATCVIDHLQLNSSKVQFHQVDEILWKQRPISSEMINAAVRNVIYLNRLKKALTEKLNAELMSAVDLYLAANRDAKNEEIATISLNILPHDFQKNWNNSLKKKSAKELMTRNNEVYFEHQGVRIYNKQDAENPNMVITHLSNHKINQERLHQQDDPSSYSECQQIVNENIHCNPDPKESNNINPINNVDKKDETVNDKSSIDVTSLWEKIRIENKQKQEPKKLDINQLVFTAILFGEVI